MAQHIEAVHQSPFPLAIEQVDIETLKQSAKEYQASLVSRLLEKDAQRITQHTKETDYLIEEGEFGKRWNRSLVEGQPTQILINLLTIIENREDIILEDPRLLK